MNIDCEIGRKGGGNKAKNTCGVLKLATVTYQCTAHPGLLAGLWLGGPSPTSTGMPCGEEPSLLIASFALKQCTMWASFVLRKITKIYVKRADCLIVFINMHITNSLAFYNLLICVSIQILIDKLLAKLNSIICSYFQDFECL